MLPNMMFQAHGNLIRAKVGFATNGCLVGAEEARAIRVPIDAEGPAIPRQERNLTISHEDRGMRS